MYLPADHYGPILSKVPGREYHTPKPRKLIRPPPSVNWRGKRFAAQSRADVSRDASISVIHKKYERASQAAVRVDYGAFRREKKRVISRAEQVKRAGNRVPRVFGGGGGIDLFVRSSYLFIYLFIYGKHESLWNTTNKEKTVFTKETYNR